MGRLFESIIRKKKVSPVILEFFCLTLILLCCFALMMIGKLYWDLQISGRIPITKGSLGIYGITIGIYIVFQIFWIRCFVGFIKMLCLRKRKQFHNVVFIDQAKYPVCTNKRFDTFLYVFLKEPYIYRMRFILDTFHGDPYTDTREKMHFNLPVSKTFTWNNKATWYENQYLSDEVKTDPLKKSRRFSSYSSQRKLRGREWNRYLYYITYDKAQLLNQLFDIVDPPVFKVMVNDETSILHEIHPIDGREYPEEAYELMKKINQMYP